ncbi:Prolyl endopeptidase [subsurface metagenome]
MEFKDRTTTQSSWPNITENDRCFYTKTTSPDLVTKLYFKLNKESEEELLFDPGSFEAGSNTVYQLAHYIPSHDGSKVAISLMQKGLEIPLRIIINVDSKELYPEKLERSFNFSWLPDGSGFLHQPLSSGDPHDPGLWLNTKIYHHILNTDPSNDREIFSREKYPELNLTPEDISVPFIFNGCNFMFVCPLTTDRRLNILYAPIHELEKDEIGWKRLIKPEEEVYSFRVTENDLYILTSKDAPNFKILKTPLNNPDVANAELVIAENPDARISGFRLTKEGLFYTLSFNGVEEKVYFLAFGTDEAIELKLPLTAGSIYLATKGLKYRDLWLGISGWTSKYKRYRYLTEKDEFKLESLSAEAEYPEYAELIVEELMIESHDGVEVPLSLVYKKGMKKNGRNPVLMTAYGAYGYSLKPRFEPDKLLWVHEGGILATAHVRGGGELGSQWQRDGQKTTKANSWKDLIASAEYLISEKYSSNKKIAICGMSAGGITIGRALTERPDLFAVAIPEVGILNALRFENTTSGLQNVAEFGTVKDSVECMALIEMDAYQNINEGINYPATLITAGMNDTRVIIWQPAKFAARLQAANDSDNPILFRVNYEAGHMSTNTKTFFEDMADVLSFALWQTGHPKYQVK